MLFKPRDIGELKTKLEFLLGDGNLQFKFSINGYDLVGKKFTWDRVAERVEGVHKNQF